MSIVFRIVGHLSPVATSATDGGGTTEQPAEGEMTCTFTSPSWTEACRRRCGSQILDSCHLLGLPSYPHTLTEQALQGSLVDSE